MSEDKLKRFIEEHRAGFETEKPPRQVWNRIEAELHRDSKVKSLWGIIPAIVKIAASGLILVSLGIGVGYQIQRQKDFTYAIQNKDTRQEFREAEAYYTSQIDDKLTELGKYKSSASILDDLNQIDQVSAELKLELLKNPDQDQSILVKQMMQQYNQKLNILNKILSKLQQTENENPSLPNNKPEHDTLDL